MLAMESNAQIQMRAQPILKPSLHEAHNVECLFIFKKSKDLDSSSLGQFDEAYG
jgi:hypothetical protein